MMLRFIVLLFSFFLLSPFAGAQGAKFKVPRLTGPVIDQVGYLNRGDMQELTRLLYDLNSRGIVQLQVAIVPDLQGLPIEQVTLQMVDEWKLGNEKKDNGVLFLVSANDRRLRIEVGQGLEGAIPDVIAKRIIEDQVVPFFKQRQTSQGVMAGALSIVHLADKEFADSAAPPVPQAKGSGILMFIIFLVISSVLIAARSGLFMDGGHRGSRYGGPFGPGGGGFGGGGGGWSGGGGGFSGGGASGGW